MAVTSTNIPALITADAPRRLWRALTARLSARAVEDPEEARNRRAWIQDLVASNPDMMLNEQDLHCILHMYPGRY